MKKGPAGPEKEEEQMAVHEKQEERVSVFVPRGGKNEDPNLYVSINGRSFLLPKGQSSLVPPWVAAEIQRSQRAQQRLEQLVQQLSAGQQP